LPTTGVAAPWITKDIGILPQPGVSAQNGPQLLLTGTGGQIGGTSDSFHFLYQSLQGNGQIIARVVSAGAGTVGIMIREKLSADSRYLLMAGTPMGLEYHQRKNPARNSKLTAGPSGGTEPFWIRLVREKTKVVGYHSLDGINWVKVGASTLTLSNKTWAGLVVTSNSPLESHTAVVDSVSVERGRFLPRSRAGRSLAVKVSTDAPAALMMENRKSSRIADDTLFGQYGTLISKRRLRSGSNF
jgi:hypothetical protein